MNDAKQLTDAELALLEGTKISAKIELLQKEVGYLTDQQFWMEKELHHTKNALFDKDRRVQELKGKILRLEQKNEELRKENNFLQIQRESLENKLQHYRGYQ